MGNFIKSDIENGILSLKLGVLGAIDTTIQNRSNYSFSNYVSLHLIIDCLYECKCSRKDYDTFVKDGITINIIQHLDGSIDINTTL